MWAEFALLAYAGLACLARANHRFRALPLVGDRVARPGVVRVAGWVLLIAALMVSCHRLGARHGAIAFLGILTLAGLALVLLLSLRPRAALAITALLPGQARHPSRPETPKGPS